MNTIKCPKCGEEIKVSEALSKDIEETVIAAEHEKHLAEIEKVKADITARAKKEAEAAIELAKQDTRTELDIEKKKLQAEMATAQKKALADQELAMKNLQTEATDAKADNEKLRKEMGKLMEELREERKAKSNVELEMQKKLVEEEGKIREAATKEADEKKRLDLAAKDKTIDGLKKMLEEAQRKAAQGSQQLQGEIGELDLEETFSYAFSDDDIEPIAKGVKGGDIRQIVKSPRGTICGVMLWEVKRTKNWVDSWVPKLKENLRAEKANIPIIVTDTMPKQVSEDMGYFDGVWVCKPKLAIILATLLRKGLLDVGRQKAIDQNRDSKAEILYGFVTSHEFIQQIESMVETYRAMTEQVGKERVAYEKFWSEREKQATNLLIGTANIVGSMQGCIGQSSMPKIKGLDLLESGEDNVIEEANEIVDIEDYATNAQ